MLELLGLSGSVRLGGVGPLIQHVPAKNRCPQDPALCLHVHGAIGDDVSRREVGELEFL